MIKMKNILAENLLRFGVKNLSEADKSRLIEQTETPPQIGGGAAPGVMSIPDYNKFIVFYPKTGNYGFEAKPFSPTMVNYLGGEGSGLSGINGKTILITQKTAFTYEKMERFSLPNNSVDGVIVGSFVPRAWYAGGYWGDPTNGNGQFLYLFNREITTNYSGDINKPFLEDGEAKQFSIKPSKADLIIPIQSKTGGSGIDYYYPRVESSEAIPKTLTPQKLSPGKDFIKIRTYDGYCPEFKGYADYLMYLGYPKLGQMLGVKKV